MKTILRNISGAALLAGLITTPTLAWAQEGIVPVSYELMSSMEQWKAPRATLESVALEELTDAVRAYAGAMEDVYGLPLHEALSSGYARAVADYREAIDGEVVDTADFLAFLMGHERDAYERWQVSLEGEQTFAGFADRHFPDLVSLTEERSRSHAESGLTFLDFLDAQGKDEILKDEASSFLLSIPMDEGDECACITIMASERTPASWETYVDPLNVDHEDPWYYVPRKVKKIHYVDSARGAAKSTSVYRRTKHYDYQRTWDSDSRARSTDLVVRLSCWGGGEAGVLCPLASTCSGELAIKAEYGSRVQADIDLPGFLQSPWSKMARSLSSDFAQLLFDPPGSAPEVALFEKGVSVAVASSTGWDAENVIQGLLNIAKLVQEIEAQEEGSQEAGELNDELIEETVRNLLGMVYREGDLEGLNKSMLVEFNTAGSIPFHIQADETYKFDLLTRAVLHTDGYGGESKSEAYVNSSYGMMGVGRYYLCADKVTAPHPGAFWDVYTSGGSAPHSAATLQHMVETFVHTELGVFPTGTGAAVGHFP